jgi:hypothetical protein
MVFFMNMNNKSLFNRIDETCEQFDDLKTSKIKNSELHSQNTEEKKINLLFRVMGKLLVSLGFTTSTFQNWSKDPLSGHVLIPEDSEDFLKTDSIAARTLTPSNPDPSIPKRKFSKKAICERFRDKYKVTDAEMEIYRSRAAKLTSFVLKEKVTLFNRQTIKVNLEKKYQRPFSKLEIQAKIFSLALRVEYKFQNSSSEVLPNSEKNVGKKRKLAPHARLIRTFKKNQTNSELPAIPASALSTRDDQNQRVHLIFQQAIGQGSFNDAFFVYSTQLGKGVVYRELKECLLKDPKLLKKWEREVRLHKKLIHLEIPHILEIHSVVQMDETSGKPKRRGLLLERCEGSLYDFSTLSIDNQKKITFQLLESISGMHWHGYRHCDLKPENIFYKKNAKGEIEIRVADFGETKQATRSDGLMGLYGTKAYQPPEYLKMVDLKPEDQMDLDVWAIGRIAWNFLKEYDMHIDKRIEEIDYEYFEIIGKLQNKQYTNRIAEIILETRIIRSMQRIMIKIHNILSNSKDPYARFIGSLMHPERSKRPTAIEAKLALKDLM